MKFCILRFSIRIIECVSKSIEDVDTPDRLIYLSDWEYLGEIRLVHAPGYSRIVSTFVLNSVILYEY